MHMSRTQKTSSIINSLSSTVRKSATVEDKLFSKYRNQCLETLSLTVRGGAGGDAVGAVPEHRDRSIVK